MNLYDLFFNICLGLFIGGIIFSIISLFLAEMELESEVTEFDIDSDMDFNLDSEIEISYDPGAEIDMELDFDAEADVGMEVGPETDLEAEAIGTTTTPAPIMLLISSFLLVFGISGIASYYLIPNSFKSIMFLMPILFGFLAVKGLNEVWKKITKSRYYIISSTQNLIGKQGVVVLPVDKRGGVIRIQSNTPMKQEKVHVKPLDHSSKFERGTMVYIVDVKDKFLLVDRKMNSTHKISKST